MMGGAASARRRSSSAAVRVSAAELPDSRVYQRASGAATLALSGTYTGTASAVYARVISAETGAEAVTWTAAATSPAGGVWSGTLSVPQGGWYKIQYRLSADPAAVHTAVNRFGIGDVWMMAGEGQQARMSTLVNTPPDPDSKTVYFISGTTWTPPGVTAGTGGNGGIKFLNLMRLATNVPQALVQVSVEGTAITDWETGDAAYNTAVSRLTAVADAAGILWHQGGTGIGAVTKADYKARLAALRTGLTSAAVSVQRFGVYPLMHRTNAADSDAATQEIRQAHYEYLSENQTVINLGWRPDVLMGDDIHQAALGSEQIASEYAHALLYQMGVETAGNLGPEIIAASRVGRILTLTVQHRSGTALRTSTGLAPTGFQVFPRNAAHADASALAISSITVNASTIEIELAADPGGGVDIYYQYGRFDQTNPVFDNTVFLGDTAGNALQPLMTPIQNSLEAGALSSPAVKLDGTTGHIRYGLTDNWYFPDADWTIGIWARIDEPAGSLSQHLVSSGALNDPQSFNLVIYEANQTGTGRAGAVEFNIRGSGGAVSALGLATPANLNTDWRLWIVERVKASETINVYAVPINGVRTLQATIGSTGLGAVTPTTVVALGTRAPPNAASGRWLSGGIWEVFRLNALLTADDMKALANGADIIGTLAKPAILRNRFTTLATPAANSGTGNPVNAALNGGITVTEGPLFAVQTNAVQFNETGMIYTMPDSNSFTTPANGDWTIGFIVALDENAGTFGQYLWSTGGTFANNCINIFFWETGSANPDKFGISLDDGLASQDVEIISTNPVTPTLNGGYYLWTVERDISTTRINIYYTPVNGVRVLLHSHLPASVLGQLNPPTAVMTIGGRNALAVPANRYFGGKMHMAFQLDGKLTQFQNQDIARGRDLMTALGLAPKWYHKFTTTAATLTDLSGNGNTATLSGGTAVVVVGPTFTPNG